MAINKEKDEESTLHRPRRNHSGGAFRRADRQLPEVPFRAWSISALRFLRQHTDYEFVMVSNQDGLGTESYPESDFLPTHQLMLDILHGEVVDFDAIHIVRRFPADNLPTRKPGTGMLTA